MVLQKIQIPDTLRSFLPQDSHLLLAKIYLGSIRTSGLAKNGALSYFRIFLDLYIHLSCN